MLLKITRKVLENLGRQHGDTTTRQEREQLDQRIDQHTFWLVTPRVICSTYMKSLFKVAKCIPELYVYPCYTPAYTVVLWLDFS